jgi:hypothetical protein
MMYALIRNIKNRQAPTSNHLGPLFFHYSNFEENKVVLLCKVTDKVHLQQLEIHRLIDLHIVIDVSDEGHRG